MKSKSGSTFLCTTINCKKMTLFSISQLKLILKKTSVRQVNYLDNSTTIVFVAAD